MEYCTESISIERKWRSNVVVLVIVWDVSSLDNAPVSDLRAYERGHCEAIEKSHLLEPSFIVLFDFFANKLRVFSTEHLGEIKSVDHAAKIKIWSQAENLCVQFHSKVRE